MAYTVNVERVATPSPSANTDGDGNQELRGAFVGGSIDISSYAAPEVVTASSLGLRRIYGFIPVAAESAEHTVHNSVPASDRASVSLTIDDVGTGTEAGADSVGKISFIAFGEAQGSGENS